MEIVEQDQVNGGALAVDAIRNVASLMVMAQHKWGHKITSVVVGQEVRANKNAKGKAVEVKINLANGFEDEISKVTRIMSRAYHAHMRMTIPWGADAKRLLANLMLIEYYGEMQTHLVDLDKAKAHFLTVLPACITKAVELNGDLGDASHYPTPQEIVDLYSFTTDPEPLGAEFAGLPDGFEEKFQMNYEARVSDMMAGGIRDARLRLSKLVTAFREVLGSDKPKFFQGTLDNIAMLGLTISHMNVTSDPELQSIFDATQLISAEPAEHLRDNMTMRLSVTAVVNSLCKVLGCAISAPVPVVASSGSTVAVVEEVSETRNEEPAPEVTPEPEPEPEADPNGIADLLNDFDF